MSNLKVANLPAAKADALIAGYNQICQASRQHYHSPFGTDGTVNAALITSADASSLGTSKTLAKELADDLTAHGADTAKHSAADVIACAAFVTSPAEPLNLTEVQNVLNEVKADLLTHLKNATPHRRADQVSALISLITATADASDQGTSNTLANVLKNALNAHDRDGAQGIDLVAS